MPNNFNQLKKTALISALLLEITASAQAATITVDNSTCTLANAITSANNDSANGGCTAGSGADIIELPHNSIIELDDALPAIENNYLTLNCNNSTITRSSEAEAFRIISISLIEYSLTLNDCIITNGIAPFASRNRGGGVGSNFGSYYSELNVNRSIISSNIGGGVFAIGARVNIRDSIISGNIGHPTAGYNSSGLSFYGCDVVIENSTISENKTYGNASGGGVSLIEGYSQNETSLSIINSTISNNSSVVGGGGIHVDGSTSSNYETSVTLKHVTLVNNTTQEHGGGLSNVDGGIEITNSIISGNSAFQGNEIFTTGANSVVNLIDFNLLGLNGDAGVSGFVFDNNSTNAIIQNTDLSEVIEIQLSDNGGYTPTHALAQNSPAIDFIPAASCIEMIDQTGKARPLDGDDDGTADCDVGAYEKQGDLIFEDGFEGGN